ncbi:haloacid dehalogenase [Stygiolobus caldivivus]|uniref:Haloacid dehalogenase n=1 Tax=Stygiolobus caldivivus TaxID=2824673 RepID=A0A8D5UA20_9CREN|nr:haloacid dehalogenase [Stygiolobus caldivivus]BCU71409.1 haloacid dehalogenase [Stygiolobus caldivivus]
MDITIQIKEYVEKITPRLQERFDSREKLLLLSREVIRYAGETISLSHKMKEEEASKKYQQAIQKLKELQEVVNNFPELLYGDVGTAFQEVAEASVVYSIYFGQKIPTGEELGIPDVYYVLGIADAIGELRRRVLELLRKREVDKAEETYAVMEELYEILWELEYPKALVPNLRQKIDSLRRLLEETNHDLFLAHLE